MSNYTKTTDFEAKDSLPTGDSGKIIRGAEFETEFDAISTAIATKADTAGPTFTGTLTFETISDGTIGVTAFVDEDNMASDSATLVPTQQSVKAYVDSQVTAQDLDFQADSGGALSIDLDSEALTLTGGTGIDTSGALNEVTFAIDSTVATLTGTQTLTNKTLTTPTISGNLTTDGTIDGRDVAADGTKLDGIEASATADQTAAEIRTLVDSATDSNVFTDADHTKLDGIEASATADQTAAEIRTLVDSATDSNVFTDADHTKLDGIETGATADQTDAEIRAAVEAATDSNVFTDADHTKLDGIEASADVTDTANVTAAGALMDSEVTNLAQVKAFDSSDYATAAQGSTADSALQNVVEDTTPQLGGDLASNGNDILFADSDKAIFGAGSDLQIYHNGTDSYIYDGGAGDLNIRGQSKVRLSNAAGTNYFQGTNGAEARVYYNGSTKLATTSTGIDVTGTVVADGLESSGALNFTAADGIDISGKESIVVRIDSDDNDAGRVFQVLSGPSASQEILIQASEDAGVSLYYDNASKLETTSTGIDVTGTVTADGLTVDSSSPVIELAAGNNNDSRIVFSEAAADIYSIEVNGTSGSLQDFTIYHDLTSATTARFQINQNGDISFYEDTGTTAKLFWDASAESLGIGITNPAAKLEVAGTTNDALFNLTGAGTNFELRATSGNGATANSSVYRLALDYLNGTHTNGFIDFYRGAAGNDGYLAFGSTGTERMRIDSSGNIGIGTSSPDAKLRVEGDGTWIRHAGYGQLLDLGNWTDGLVRIESTNAPMYIKAAGSYYMAFDTNSAERMRLDSSGNLLVGSTSSAMTTGGTMLAGGSAGYLIQSHASSVGSGEWYSIFKHGASVIGSITQSGTTAVLFNTSSDQRLKDNIVDAPSASNDIDAIQVRSFDWKANGSHQKYGMVAQELQTVAPEAVSEGATEEDMMGVDYSKLVPMMLKEIQSLRARVAQLEGEN